MLSSYLERLEKIDDAIEANYEIIKIICEDQEIFVNDDRPSMKVNQTPPVTGKNVVLGEGKTFLSDQLSTFHGGIIIIFLV